MAGFSANNKSKESITMLYELDLSKIPCLEEVQEHERKTVWKCSHRRNTLVFITAGSCYFKINNKEKLVSGGETILIPAGTEYERRPANDQPATFIYTHFTGNVTPVHTSEEERVRELIRSEATDNANMRNFDDTSVNSKILISDVMRHKDFELVTGMLADCINAYKSGLPLGRTLASLKLGEILVLISRERLLDYAYPHAVDDSTAFPAPLNSALVYIKEHFNHKVTVPDLCSAANVTPQHMIRLFNKHLGQTPIKYINRTKIMSAIEMLRSTDLSVKEISYELGFDNPNYFSRIFTREMGMSPVEKRNHIRSYKPDEHK